MPNRGDAFLAGKTLGGCAFHRVFERWAILAKTLYTNRFRITLESWTGPRREVRCAEFRND